MPGWDAGARAVSREGIDQFGTTDRSKQSVDGTTRMLVSTAIIEIVACYAPGAQADEALPPDAVDQFPAAAARLGRGLRIAESEHDTGTLGQAGVHAGAEHAILKGCGEVSVETHTRSIHHTSRWGRTVIVAPIG